MNNLGRAIMPLTILNDSGSTEPVFKPGGATNVDVLRGVLEEGYTWRNCHRLS